MGGRRHRGFAIAGAMALVLGTVGAGALPPAQATSRPAGTADAVVAANGPDDDSGTGKADALGSPEAAKAIVPADADPGSAILAATGTLSAVTDLPGIADDTAYYLQTPVGAVPIEPAGLGSASVGDTVSVRATIPSETADALEVPAGAVVPADSETGAAVIDAATAPLQLQSATVDASAAAAAGTTQTVDIAFVTVNGVAPSSSQSTVTSWLSYASSYYATQSGGRVAAILPGSTVSFATTRWSSCDPSNIDAIWSEAAAKLHTGWTSTNYQNSGGRHLLVVVPGSTACQNAWGGSIGIANLGSGAAYGGSFAVLDSTPTQRQTVVHEFGHNLGLQHAEAYACTPLQLHWEGADGCSASAYYDIYDPMGFGVASADYDSPAMNPPHREALGFYQNGGLVTVAANSIQQVTLLPVQQTSGVLAVKAVDKNGYGYYLDLRNGLGSESHAAYASLGGYCFLGPFCAGDYGVRITQAQSGSTETFATASKQADGDSVDLVAGDRFSSWTCDVFIRVDSMTMSGGRPTSATLTIATGTKAPACGGDLLGVSVSDGTLHRSTTDGVWTPHGVNRPGLEYACVQGWKAAAPTAAETATMVAWGIDTVRIPLNADCWLGTHGAPATGSGTAAEYRAAVQQWVSTFNAAGIAAILDLHWSGASLALQGQHAMPDAQAVSFWSQVAAAFSNQPGVMFELFNEPYSRSGYPLTWACWKSGGPDCVYPIEPDTVSTASLSGSTYQAVGMQDLVTAIRNAGAAQPIIVDGLDYANDLSGWAANAPVDPLGELVAGFHDYPGQACAGSDSCLAGVVALAAQVPVLMTEFGYTAGAPAAFEQTMSWADQHDIGYLPWAWWDGASAGMSAENAAYALYTGSSFTAKAPAGTGYLGHLAALGDASGAFMIARYVAALPNAAILLGSPIDAVTCGLVDGGCWQDYQRATVHWSAASGAHRTDGDIRSLWGRLGWEHGVLGYPVADVVGHGAPGQPGRVGYSQEFQGGTVFWNAQYGAVSIRNGPIRDYFESTWGPAFAANNAAGYVFPTGEAFSVTAGSGTGQMQFFDRAAVLATPSHGTVAIPAGAILTAFRTAGVAAFGWPVSAVSCDAAGCQQAFDNGVFYVAAGTGSSYLVSGDLLVGWQALGGGAGSLGAPTGSAFALSTGSGAGQMQFFQRGALLATPVHGAVAIPAGAILTAFRTAGVARFGWPVSAVSCDAAGCQQAFDNGLFFVAAGTGSSYWIAGDILTGWQALGGGTGSLGAPVGDAFTVAASGHSGPMQFFQRGAILATPTNGPVAIPAGAILTAFRTAGVARFGWPVSAVSCDSTGCRQEFDNGVFTVAFGASSSAWIPKN